MLRRFSLGLGSSSSGSVGTPKKDEWKELRIDLEIGDGTLGISTDGVTLSGMTISSCNRVVAVSKGSRAEQAGLRVRLLPLPFLGSTAHCFGRLWAGF